MTSALLKIHQICLAKGGTHGLCFARQACPGRIAEGGESNHFHLHNTLTEGIWQLQVLLVGNMLQDLLNLRPSGARHPHT